MTAEEYRDRYPPSDGVLAFASDLEKIFPPRDRPSRRDLESMATVALCTELTRVNIAMNGCSPELAREFNRMVDILCRDLDDLREAGFNPARTMAAFVAATALEFRSGVLAMMEVQGNA